MKFFKKRSNSQDYDDVGAEPVVASKNDPRPPPMEDGRPKLSSAFADELRLSVHNMQEGKPVKKKGLFRSIKQKLSSAGGESKKSQRLNSPPQSPPRQQQMPETQEEVPEELKASFSDLQGDRFRVKVRSPGDERFHQRPTLSKDIAEELRVSFHNRDSKKSGRRDEIKERIRKKREASGHGLNPHSNGGLESVWESDSESDNDSFENEPASLPIRRARPSLSRDVADELRQSFAHRTEKKQGNRREVVERIRKRRESQRSAESETGSLASFDEAIKSPKQKKGSLGDRLGGDKRKSSLKDTMHSTDTFDASFSDNETVFTWRRESSHVDRRKPKKAAAPIVEEDEDDSKSYSDSESKEGSSKSYSDSESIEEREDDGKYYSDSDDSNDAEAFKAEIQELKKEKTRLKAELRVSTSTNSKLKQTSEDLKAETVDLRKQLSNWQEKASKISKKSSEDRIKADSSTDAIAKARVKLTKALNENKLLKTKCSDLENFIDKKDMRLKGLEENLLLQSRKLDDMAIKIKDTEAELRFNRDEKQRLDEEVAVLAASRDGRDVSATIRRLEQEKGTLLKDRERELEAKRAALEEENDKMLERERRRHQKEADQHKVAVAKADRKQQENKRLQQEINQQLKDMRNENAELQERITASQLDQEAELKEREERMSSQKHKMSRLQKRLAASELQVKKNESRLAYAKSAVEELKEVKKKNKILEKEIARLQSGKRSRGIKSDDWKEIVLPGYRGVTFGPESESLAGFLTILVEEQSKKSSRRGAKSTKMDKFIKSQSDETKKKGSKSRSKGKEAPQSASRKTKRSSKNKKDDKKKADRKKSKKDDKKDRKDDKTKLDKSKSKKDVKKKLDKKAETKKSGKKDDKKISNDKAKKDSAAKKTGKGKGKSESSQHAKKKSKGKTKKEYSKGDKKKKLDSKTKSESSKQQQRRSTEPKRKRHDVSKSAPPKKKDERTKNDDKKKSHRSSSHDDKRKTQQKAKQPSNHSKKAATSNIAFKERRRSINNLETTNASQSSMVALKIEHKSKRREAQQIHDRIRHGSPPSTIVLQ